MASTLTSYPAKNIGTVASTVKTVSAGTVVILVSVYISNTLGSQFNADLYVTRGGVDYYLANDVPIPAGGALVPISVGKVILIASDALKVVASQNSAGDVWASALEKTTS